MRTPDQLIHSRARLRPRYALFPLEGFPVSRLPSCPEAEARVLASAALGAQFVEMLVDLPAGATLPTTDQPGIETFYFVLSGHGKVSDAPRGIEPGSYGLIAPGAQATVHATDKLRLLVLQKRYEPAKDVEIFKSLHRHESQAKKEPWADNPQSLLQTLIPDRFDFDLAMNIFTFDPGCGLPVVETHVMEHGLFFLQGKGIYFLGDQWMEVQADDFIWMGPYCPQSFYATGPTPSRYLYYKNVNREILP